MEEKDTPVAGHARRPPTGDFRQHDPAAPAAAVSDMLVTVSGGEVSLRQVVPHRRRYVHPWPVAPLGWHY
jgi:hypothetical protein